MVSTVTFQKKGVGLIPGIDSCVEFARSAFERVSSQQVLQLSFPVQNMQARSVGIITINL